MTTLNHSCPKCGRKFESSFPHAKRLTRSEREQIQNEPCYLCREQAKKEEGSMKPITARAFMATLSTAGRLEPEPRCEWCRGPGLLRRNGARICDACQEAQRNAELLVEMRVQ